MWHGSKSHLNSPKLQKSILTHPSAQEVTYASPETVQHSSTLALAATTLPCAINPNNTPVKTAAVAAVDIVNPMLLVRVAAGMKLLILSVNNKPSALATLNVPVGTAFRVVVRSLRVITFRTRAFARTPRRTCLGGRRGSKVVLKGGLLLGSVRSPGAGWKYL
jgi:hypothetical protein